MPAGLIVSREQARSVMKSMCGLPDTFRLQRKGKVLASEKHVLTRRL